MATVAERAQLALAPMPPWMGSEHAVLAGLARGGSAQQALQRAPHKLRLMYVHAYQSKLWNAAAAGRAELGLDVLPGDLVLVGSPGTAAGDAADAGDAMADGGEEAAAPEETEAEAEAGGAPTAEHRAKGEVRGLRGRAVHRVTASEAAAKAFAIDQVVLPLPGHAVEYPSYSPTPGASAAVLAASAATAAAAADKTEAATTTAAAAETAETGENPKAGDGFYDALLAADGLTQSSLKRLDEYSLSGDYRPLLQRASEFEWRLARYTDATDVVIPSDADRLAAALAAKHLSAKAAAAPTADGAVLGDAAGSAVVVSGEGPELALALSFTLPSSSYATVFLRELLKQPMDSGHHTALTHAFNAADGDDAVAGTGAAAGAGAGAAPAGKGGGNEEDNAATAGEGRASAAAEQEGRAASQEGVSGGVGEAAAEGMGDA
jgi:tRNA pseudouridine13 synthase